ncbi:ash family protein [Salmonella enterica subsp. enterica serovar Kinondoni]|nr:ash family protein [Salmonella enterica subsp. enterica serovar Kinondoni]
MTTYKNRLPQSALMGYISRAPHKTGAGIGTPQLSKAHNRASGFFTCDASPQLFRIMAGRTGQPQGWPGSLLTGSTNPVRLATQRLVPLAGEFLHIQQGSSSWPTVNNASAAIRSRVSTPKPKSTADCTAPTIWRSSCVSKCLLNPATDACYGCRQFWTTSPTISATFRSCLTSQRTPRNPPHAPLFVRGVCASC